VLNAAVICANDTTVQKHQDRHHNVYENLASCRFVNRNLYLAWISDQYHRIYILKMANFSAFDM